MVSPSSDLCFGGGSRRHWWGLSPGSEGFGLGGEWQVGEELREDSPRRWILLQGMALGS